MSELKPCPFCGNNQIWEKSINSTNTDRLEYYCTKCKTVAPAFLWNKRVLKKSESAWKMFRRLFIRGLSKLEWEKINSMLIKYGYSDDCILAVWLLNLCSEQEAIKIMREIEKDLKHEN